MYRLEETLKNVLGQVRKGEMLAATKVKLCGSEKNKWTGTHAYNISSISLLANRRRACSQWCANGCNNSQQCWDLQCIVGRIQPISLCKPCVMSVRGPNNVGRAVQTDPTLLRYASTITEQKKCWESLAEKFDRLQTLRNNTQQHPTTWNRVCKRTQQVTSNNVGSSWPTMLRPFAPGSKRVTRKFLEVSFCSRAKQRQKKCFYTN